MSQEELIRQLADVLDWFVAWEEEHLESPHPPERMEHARQLIALAHQSAGQLQPGVATCPTCEELIYCPRVSCQKLLHAKEQRG